MYITYNYLNNCNDNDIEGVGSQYLKIITLYAVTKYYNLKYIHIPIRIGHNYNNDDDWDNKWDRMFNLKKISYNDEIDLEKIEKNFTIDNYPFELLIKDKTENKLHFYFCVLQKFIDNRDYLLETIQDDIINAYNENNMYRTLIYDKNKINIAIHIRVFNDCDTVTEDINKYLSDDPNYSARYYLTADIYISLIEDLKEIYKNSDIHIFSQEKYFNLKYEKLRYINNIKIHFDDIDTFDIFNHLCKADVLVMGLSTLSIIAAFYNKNTIINIPYETLPALNKWIKYIPGTKLKI